MPFFTEVAKAVRCSANSRAPRVSSVRTGRSGGRSGVVVWEGTLSGVRRYTPSLTRLALKESDLNHDGAADEIDHHKHDQLRKQQDGKNHWKDELASDSESAVKADREEHLGGTEKDIGELQERTKASAEEDHKKR
ncbi:MAG: hypothetical protein M1837_007396 [Sclerophora amabilis]|nr:MAG: hypothetical protein M1837_007396 [Sclerophora amabilis]